MPITQTITIQTLTFMVPSFTPVPTGTKGIALFSKPGEKTKGRKKSKRDIFGVRRVTYMGEDLPHAVGLKVSPPEKRRRRR
jgi:hypothetical protein